MIKNYAYYKQLSEQLPSPPYALLDLDLLNQNISDLLTRAKDKKIRLASKSIRCPYVIKHILETSDQFQGIMSFTILESIFLASLGLDNILLGYPSMQESQIAQLIDTNISGKKIIPMVDCEEQVSLINSKAKSKNFIQEICVDIDMSTDFPGLHFGVYRSPINSTAKFKSFLSMLRKYPAVKLSGIMGYEAQVAGLGDKGDTFIKNNAIQLLQKISIKEFAHRRKKCYEMAVEAGHDVVLVNGGGTGSIETTLEEDHVTEITIGSGFYSPALFDNYSAFKHHPALIFALEIVRSPMKKMFTALGGGYMASGSIGWDKQPKPFLPKGIQLMVNEGCGEVQTPFTYSGSDTLKLGDPIFFRHAKAGELCERFNEIVVVSEGKVLESVPTYRGLGQCFL